MNNDELDILTTKEGAGLLRMSQQKLRELATTGALPAFHVGSRWRYRRSDLLGWVEAQALANVTPPTKGPWPRSWSSEKIQEQIRLRHQFIEQGGDLDDPVGWAKFLTDCKTDGAAE